MKKFDLKLYRTEGMAMHCKSATQAEIFCKYLDSQGRTWINSESYVQDNCYEVYGNKTLYFFNEGTYDKLTDKIEEEHYILEFDDFDWRDQTNSLIKKKLKNGDIVETEDNLFYLVLNEILIGDYECLNLDRYNDDLTFNDSTSPEFNIEKIYEVPKDVDLTNITELLIPCIVKNYNLIWKRDGMAVDLTKSQIEKMLGYSINIVDEEASKS